MILSPAKINLSLSIKKQLKNGYHLITSHVIFLDLFDKISIKKAPDNIVQIIGPFEKTLNSSGGESLIKRTLLLFQEQNITNDNFNVLLEKNIPVSAGLGGGSSNSATIIRYLMKYGCCNDKSKIQKLAKSLGADVPACLYSKPVLMSGIGEKLRFIEIKNNLDFGVVLINPNFQLSTKEVFTKLKLTKKKIKKEKFLEINNLNEFYKISKLGNDLKSAALNIVPEIGTAFKLFKNVDDCICSGMSGSGPTCYGIFKSREKALKFKNNIQKSLSKKAFWTWAGGLLLNSKRDLILPIE